MSHPNDSKEKSLIFCLDKSSNSHLKQCLTDYSTRIFHDGKCLIKSLFLSEKASNLPAALIITGNFQAVQQIITHSHQYEVKTLIFCPNSNRQIYEPLVKESLMISRIVGLFTNIEDLKEAINEIVEHIEYPRIPIRFITNHLDDYLWYEFLKETALKMSIQSKEMIVDLPVVNRQLQIDPIMSLYTLRSSIAALSEQKIVEKKLFYGQVIKRSLLDQIQSNVNNLISFHFFVQFQGTDRITDARRHSLLSCSRRQDEVSVIFELESANQSTFQIVRVFCTNEEYRLWVVQLIGTDQCEKLVRKFIRIKRMNYQESRWRQNEILFGLILIEMNEIEKARRYFFEYFIHQYERTSRMRSAMKALWDRERQYLSVVNQLAIALDEIKSSTNANLSEQEETIYVESEIDSDCPKPISFNNEQNISRVLNPTAYDLDLILSGDDGRGLKSSTQRNCTLL